jgi:cytochrome c biogenesis protein CcmG, thiol:disulfide interchange protein DsbE
MDVGGFHSQQSNLVGVSARTFWAFLGVLAVVGLLAYGLISKSGNSIDIGARFPGRTLDSLDGGRPANIADYRGKWVLVNLWASWCAPCREEAPALEQFDRAERKHDFTVLGVDSKDLSTDAQRFVDEFGVTYPQLHDGPGDLAGDLGTVGFPESFLVDPKGRLALIRRGTVTPDFLRSVVAPLIRRQTRGSA